MLRTCFNHILFRWYKKHGRHRLPWRHTRDPYRILVSEVMLQQTQVERVLPKYREFLRRFPTVAALASAPLGNVLRTWSGLGYNRRARYLHDCAKQLIANSKWPARHARQSRLPMPEHVDGGQVAGVAGGRMAKNEGRRAQWPHTFSGLLELPGIGPSTAAAISSFSFDADEPMIDTNIRRIVVRVFFKHDGSRASEDRKKIPSDKSVYACTKAIIPKNRGREWNWAMMDVGALLCKAKGHSDACPFQRIHGPVGDFTYKKPQKKFAGSARYYRGRILARLAAAARGITRTTLRATLGISKKKFLSITAALRRESLIKMSGKKLLLP